MYVLFPHSIVMPLSLCPGTGLYGIPKTSKTCASGYRVGFGCVGWPNFYVAFLFPVWKGWTWEMCPLLAHNRLAKRRLPVLVVAVAVAGGGA